MLYSALLFLFVALVAGFVGLSGVAGVAVAVAKGLFALFLALFVISLLAGSRNPPPA